MKQGKRVRVMVVPYHLGRKNVSLGRGPMALINAGLQDKLRQAGLNSRIMVVHRQKPFTSALEATADVNKQLARLVKESVTAGEFPLVLAGDCNSSIGILGGLETASMGVVWCDAHGDFNTPETSLSGCFDGMALAILTGDGHASWRKKITSLPPVEKSRVVLIGVRDLDPGEKMRLKKSSITQITPKRMRTVGAYLETLCSRVQDIYLHVDMDIFDPGVAPANAYQTDGGVSLTDMLGVVRFLASRVRIRAAALTAFDPAFDGEGKTRKIGVRIGSEICVVE